MNQHLEDLYHISQLLFIFDILIIAVSIVIFILLVLYIKSIYYFDIVVVDPPSFAKKASEVPGALRSYERLAKLAIPLVGKNGTLVLASCSSRVKADEFFAVAEQALRQSNRRFQELDRTFHDIDHPIGIPEGAYLKCTYYRLD